MRQARELNGINDVAIVRVEQLAPFPFDLVQKFADQYVCSSHTAWHGMAVVRN